MSTNLVWASELEIFAIKVVIQLTGKSEWGSENQSCISVLIPCFLTVVKTMRKNWPSL